MPAEPKTDELKRVIKFLNESIANREKSGRTDKDFVEETDRIRSEVAATEKELSDIKPPKPIA